MECKEFLNKLVKKVMEKSPLKFSLAWNMSFMDPREMGTTAKESNLKKFKAVLTTMNEANRVADNEVDELSILTTQLRHMLQNTGTLMFQQGEWMYSCSTPWPTTHLCVSFGRV